MRSNQEIKDYIISQDWYAAFIRYARRQHDENHVQNLLSGRFGEGTIENAFVWAHTLEGEEWWRCQHYKFVKWYNNR